MLDRLLATSAVTALVSTRIYALKLPQDPVTPAVRVQLIDEPSEYHLRGDVGLTRARVQTDCYVKENVSGGNPYGRANTLADAVHVALSGQTFQNAGSPAEIEVSGCFRASRIVMYESAEFNAVRVMQDYIVWSRSLN